MLEINSSENPLHDFPFFAENFFKIKSKAGDIRPLKLNRAQIYVHNLLETQRKETGKVRAIIVKGRQQGMSTMIGARFAHRVITKKGMKAFILTHEKDATTNLFEITKRYIQNLPAGLCPAPDTSSANKLEFKGFQSGYSVGTAGNKTTGRSLTIQLFHGSECAYWPTPKEHAKGAMNAVSNENGTEIIIESTANGIGNYFHSIWLSAINKDSEYIPIFVPWYWQDEYTSAVKDQVWTDEEKKLLEEYGSDGLTEKHLAWRRLKIGESGDWAEGENSFKQEYPFSWKEAFRSPVENAYISSELVMKARVNKVNCDDIALILGVDVAIGDNDETAIIRRRGRRAYNLEGWRNHNTMETATRIANIIDAENPYKVYIDVIGIGAGVVDRLHERGYYMVEGINVANRAAERSKYHNKRAELWAAAKAHLSGDADIEVPDDDEFHGQLCNVGYKTDQAGRLQMESKDEIRKRGLPSPDRADAYCLTFAGGQMINIQAMMPTPQNMEQIRRDACMFF